jgi:hypothetical protein
LARRTARELNDSEKEKGKDYEVCPCCGYEVDRKEI